MLRNTVALVSFNGMTGLVKKHQDLNWTVVSRVSNHAVKFHRVVLTEIEKKNCNGNLLLLLYKESGSQYTRF